GAHGPGDNPDVKKDTAGQPEPGKEMPDKLVGSWKARLTSPFGLAADVVVTFNKDGGYREGGTNLQGQPFGPTFTGRWQFRDGDIHIVLDNGVFRRQTLTWIDNDTMDQRLVESRPLAPLQPTYRFRRQTDPITPNGLEVAQKKTRDRFRRVHGGRR